MSFPDVLSSIFKSQKLTATGIAKEMDCSQVMISKFTTGKALPTPTRMHQLVTVLEKNNVPEKDVCALVYWWTQLLMEYDDLHEIYKSEVINIGSLTKNEKIMLAMFKLLPADQQHSLITLAQDKIE